MRRIVSLATLSGCFFFTFLSAQPTIPVDPLTGRAMISFPLGQVNEGDISVGVALTYNGGGVRVEEGEGSAGVGWEIGGVGSVVRSVRGLPDDFVGTDSETQRRGWLFDNLAQTINNFTPIGDENLAICTDEEGDYDFLWDLYMDKHDTEPDIFTVFGPNLSAQFIFGTDGLPKLIPYQDLEIEITWSVADEIQSIKITNNLGIVYTFDIKERVTRSAGLGSGPNYLSSNSRFYGESISFYSSWHLSKIQSPSGNEITVSYIDMDDPIISKDEVKIANEAGEISTIYSIEDEFTPRLVEKIDADATEMNFTWQDGRIKEVAVVDKETDSERSFSFVYEDVKDYRETGPGIRKAFLKEIYESGNCNAFPSYTFTYSGVDFTGKTTLLPFKERNHQDLFGFYNGSSADNLPDIYIYDNLDDAERYRIHSIPGQSPSASLSGSDRFVDSNAIKAGSLTQVGYPAGNTATITYEPNDYYDAEADETFQGGGIRVKSVSISAGEKGSENMVTDYEYTRVDGESSGSLLYRPVFAFAIGDEIIRSLNNLAPDGGVLYSRTTVKQTGKGKTVYEFLNPAVYPSVSESDWTAAKSRIARYLVPQEPGQPVPPCVSLGNQHTGYYSYPFAPNMNFDFERGLPDRITDYAENGTLVQERIYSYQRINSGTTTVKGLRYEKLDSNFVYSIYSLKAGINKATLTETIHRADDVNPSNLIETISTYTYSSVHNMLQDVSTTNSDGIIYKTEYRYAKDFNITNPNTSQPEAVALKALNDNRRHGEIIETIQTRNDGSGEAVTGAALTLFKDYGSGKILKSQDLVFPAVAGFTEATVTGTPQSLVFDTDYIPAATYETYNSTGAPLSVSDNKKNKSGTHYGYSGSLPVASVANAFAEEFVFTDFESSTGFDLSVSSGTGTTVEGWTGENALAITSSTILASQNINKGSDSYRFSCWATAASAVQITFKAKNGAVVQATGTLNYSTGQLNEWQYLEGEISMAGVNSSFTLEVTSNGSVTLDDIRFYPASSVMTTTTYKPFAGATSVTDERGVSGFKEYDPAGRLRYIKDRNKNLVQVNEYRYKKEPPASVLAAFTTSISEELIQDDEITFMATGNDCLTGLSYEWTVSDGTTNTVEGTNSTLVYTFEDAGYYTVHLRVESASGHYDETFADYCVQSGPGSSSGTATANVLEPYENCPHDYTELYECESGVDNYVRTLITKPPTGCSDLQNIEYTWFYRFAGMNDWLPVPDGVEDDGKKLIFDVYDYQSPDSFDIKVVITGNCADGQYPCYDSVPFSAEKTINFTYIDGLPCQ